MAGNFTETAEWEEGVPKISNGEEIDETLLNQAGQVLANRTQYLKALVDKFAGNIASGNGYFIIPCPNSPTGKLILQYLTLTPGATSNSVSFSFSFPYTFPTAVVFPMLAMNASESVLSGNSEGMYLYSVTRYGGWIKSEWQSANYNSSNPIRILAIGY